MSYQQYAPHRGSSHSAYGQPNPNAPYHPQQYSSPYHMNRQPAPQPSRVYPHSPHTNGAAAPMPGGPVSPRQQQAISPRQTPSSMPAPPARQPYQKPAWMEQCNAMEDRVKELIKEARKASQESDAAYKDILQASFKHEMLQHADKKHSLELKEIRKSLDRLTGKVTPEQIAAQHQKEQQELQAKLQAKKEQLASRSSSSSTVDLTGSSQ